ncbi:hypothetical protein Tco_1259050, partial [Tanacetum coccineum]
ATALGGDKIWERIVLISGTGGEKGGDGEDAKDTYPVIRWQINEKSEREQVKEFIKYVGYG